MSVPALPASYRCSPAVAADCARILVGSYRRDDFHDPEVFIAQVTALFGGFPEEIVRQVIDPLRGLPRKSKFPPTISEVGDALDEAMRPHYERAARERKAEEERVAVAAEAGGDPERKRELLRRWEEEIRPQLVANANPNRPKETPEQALERLKAIPAPSVSSREVAAKIAAMAGDTAGGER